MKASPRLLGQYKFKPLIRWVEKMAELCTPQSIHWVDGSKEENTELCADLVKNGTFIKLNEESGRDAITRVLIRRT
jgi:GTP-dependent phosphoenolpyruvate carboxykinase